jgi:hypothetical protein
METGKNRQTRSEEKEEEQPSSGHTRARVKASSSRLDTPARVARVTHLRDSQDSREVSPRLLARTDVSASRDVSPDRRSPRSRAVTSPLERT